MNYIKFLLLIIFLLTLKPSFGNNNLEDEAYLTSQTQINYNQKNYVKTLEYLDLLIKKKNTWAHLFLATMYQQGKGVKVNYLKARELLQKAVNDIKDKSPSFKLGEALFFLAQSYHYYTNNINRDIDKAIKLYKEADVKHGYNRANYSLGYIYLNGKYVKKDYKKSFHYFSRGALLWDVECLSQMGRAYYYGYGTGVNHSKALKYFKRAASKNHLFSQFMIGKIYLMGEVDFEKAFKWFKLAAHRGHPEAQLELGSFYENGFGIIQDYKKALDWYDKAIRSKDPIISKKASQLHAKLISKSNISKKNIDNTEKITKLKDKISDLELVVNNYQRGITETSDTPSIKNSPQKFYALLIGVQNYDYLKKLNTPINDITKLSNLLKNKYGFEITYLKDPKRSDITHILNSLSRNLSKNDNLLIYYAGHGIKVMDDGYWLPKDAKEEDDTNWISNDYLSRKLKNSKATNILVLSDSCYSGTLTRDISSSFSKVNKPLKVFLNTKSRMVITSGGLSPVLDGGGGGHSIFARIIINHLTNNFEALTATKLYTDTMQDVLKLSLELGFQQSPMLANLPQSGHVGPDFVFLPKY